MLDESELWERVVRYAVLRELNVIDDMRLGYGSDGTVWQSLENSAIKAVHRMENYVVERACYQRLKRAGVGSLGGFTIPALLDFDDELQIIEMEIVSPPYLLDFGKVHLDRPPFYWNDSQMRANAYEEWRERFDDHWEDVACVLHMLEKYGIYYVDPRVANINVEGLK